MGNIVSKPLEIDQNNPKIREYIEAQERGIKKLKDKGVKIPNFESSIQSPQVRAELAAQSAGRTGVIAKIRQFFHQ